MTITCKNCHHQFKGNYCFNCGQPAETHRINFHFLVHDVEHGILHFDKGLTYTIRELFRRPGHAIREFLEGKRVRHYRPVSLVLILAGIFGLLLHYFHINWMSSTVTVSGAGPEVDKVKHLLSEANEWISGHFAVVTFLQVPFYAFGTWIAFRKATYNFIEHLVINAFLTGQRLSLRILLFPLYILLNGTETLRTLFGVLNVVNFILTIWTFHQLFTDVKKWPLFWRTALSFAIAITVFISLVAVGIYFFGSQLIQS